MEHAQLRRLVRQGEGQHLEFKRKANHLDKISREIVAFANSEGGTLLIGVDDDQSIYGVKFAEGEAYALKKYIKAYCEPAIPFTMDRIIIDARRQVIVVEVEASEKRPHYLRDEHNAEKRAAFVRVRDMSIRASREVVQLLRLSGRDKGGHLRFGDRERLLLQHLEQQTQITLPETQRLLQTNKRTTSSLLIRLVRAGLLHLQPTEKGDLFSLREEAFG